jgi:hypothetical protein
VLEGRLGDRVEGGETNQRKLGGVLRMAKRANSRTGRQSRKLWR